jgi:lysyl-tRNA synthetase class II
MVKNNSVLVSLLVVMGLVILAVSPVVFAHEGEDHSTSTNEASTDSFEQQKQKKMEDYKQQLEQKREDAKQKAEEMVEAAKNKVEAKTKEVREKNCEARKQALGNKIKNTSEAAKRHYDKITSFNQKIDEYITKNSITVTNYDALKSTVTDKAAIAESAVTSLSEYEQQVDCANIDEATAAVIAYKELLTNARDALKEYRTATKDLLVAVKSAVDATKPEDNSSEGGAN